jgi:hypothetical protein
LQIFIKKEQEQHKGTGTFHAHVLKWHANKIIDPKASSLLSLIFNHEKAAFPQLRDLSTKRCARKLQDSDPDPLVRGTDPRPYQYVTVPQLCVQLLVNVKYVKSYKTTLFRPENKTPLYRYSDPVSNPNSNPDPNVYFSSGSDPDPAARQLSLTSMWLISLTNRKFLLPSDYY